MSALQFGKALKTASELIKSREHLATGIGELDRLLDGGFVRGEISELVGSASVGRTSLVSAALARTTSQGELVAYVDTHGVADPFSVSRAGVDLTRLLWVRCDGSAEKALAAADILVRAGGFAMIILDLDGPDASSDRERNYSHAWFRIKQTLEGTRIVFLVLNPRSVAGSQAALVLALDRRQAFWAAGNHPVRARLFYGLLCEARISKGRNHGSATFYCNVRS